MEVAQCVRVITVQQREMRREEMIKYFIKSDPVPGSVDDLSSENIQNAPQPLQTEYYQHHRWQL